MTPFCINFPMNMPYYVAKHIVKPGMRQYILWPLSSYCLNPRVVLSLTLGISCPPGLNHSAYLVVEGGEGGFGAFAHGDDYLLVGDGGDIAGGIDAWDACAAMGVDDNLTNAGFLQFIERLAVGAEAYLYEYSVQGKVVLGIGCAVLQTEGSNFFSIANDLQGLG